jgi:hypothetical protein
MAYDASGEQRFTRERPPGERRAATSARGVEADEGSSRWYWLFLIPFVATFFPWIYNTRSPELFGIPFLYWYQMAWVPVSVCITVFVYRMTRGTSR